MAVEFQKHFFKAVKGKVILGSLFALLALFLAWYITSFAFAKMLAVVEKISQPSARLRIVNDLNHKIASLDQLQKKEVSGTGIHQNFLSESKQLKLTLDTLRGLYAGDAVQLARITALKKLFKARDKQFLAYLKVRENLINNKSFSNDVEKISGLVGQQSRQADSAILTTQTTTSTTTVAPDEEAKSKGFLSKLFGKKKSGAYKIISEELKVKRDTVNPQAEDMLFARTEATLRKMAKSQRAKGVRFLQEEAELAEASRSLTAQMLKILRDVEAQAVRQIDGNGIEARHVVNSSVAQISAVIIVFFLLTVILTYLILNDISNSNRYRNALELAKNEAEYHASAKQRFLSNMSHEIRTPLQAILGYSELILDQDLPKKKDVKAINQSAIHLLQIVNEILDYNRILSGEFTINKQVFKIREALEDVVSVIFPLANEKSLHLITDFDLGGIELVRGDVFRLKQVLYNVLGNAVKFTIMGKIKLTVKCKSQQDNLHFNFIVEDSGIGFSEEDVEKIFNEFEQVQSAQSLALSQGAGLGLSIVKSLVDLQGGRIHVKSKLGLGTTFSVFLKYDIADNYLEDGFDIKPYYVEKQQLVWMIDDDEVILNLCASIFEKYQIPFKCFNRVDEILNEPVPTNLKMVFVDLRLPEMTGLELCSILKDKFPPNVKYYAITAQVLPNERKTVLKSGFDGLIMKPFKVAELLSVFNKQENMEEEYQIDFTNLGKMTFGDRQLLLEILAKCAEDCLADSAALRNLLNENNASKCELIVHRLAGRLAQIGSKTLGASFRLLEVEISEKGLNPSTKEEILLQLIKLGEVIAVLEDMEAAPNSN